MSIAKGVRAHKPEVGQFELTEQGQFLGSSWDRGRMREKDIFVLRVIF